MAIIYHKHHAQHAKEQVTPAPEVSQVVHNDAEVLDQDATPKAADTVQSTLDVEEAPSEPTVVEEEAEVAQDVVDAPPAVDVSVKVTAQVHSTAAKPQNSKNQPNNKKKRR